MFTPEQGADEPAEVWYLFGAWLLAAAMNAMLTWWGVSVAIHQSQQPGCRFRGQYRDYDQGCAGFRGDHGLADPRADHRYILPGRRPLVQPGQPPFIQHRRARLRVHRPAAQPLPCARPPACNARPTTYSRPAPKPQGNYSRPEPTYQNMSFSGRSRIKMTAMKSIEKYGLQ
jgi:hypothetical protein